MHYQRYMWHVSRLFLPGLLFYLNFFPHTSPELLSSQGMPSSQRFAEFLALCPCLLENWTSIVFIWACTRTIRVIPSPMRSSDGGFDHQFNQRKQVSWGKNLGSAALLPPPLRRRHWWWCRCCGLLFGLPPCATSCFPGRSRGCYCLSSGCRLPVFFSSASSSLVPFWFTSVHAGYGPSPRVLFLYSLACGFRVWKSSGIIGVRLCRRPFLLGGLLLTYSYPLGGYISIQFSFLG